MRDKELIALLTRKAQAGLYAAAATHADLWVEEMNRPGPSKEDEFPAKKTGAAIASIEVDYKDLKSASGSNASVWYLSYLEEFWNRKGPADAYRKHKKVIADAAQIAMESQK